MIFPSPIEFAKAVGRFLKALVLRRPLFVIHDVYRARVEECGPCPWNNNGQCERCTCFWRTKAWLATESCPLGKWSKDRVRTWVP